MATEHAVSFFRLMYLSVLRFYEDNGPRMAAALAYYTIFSIPGMLIIAIAVAGAFFGKEAAQKELFFHIEGTVGNTAVKAIQGMIDSANKPGQSTIATLVGIATLLFGGSGVFLELQADMNIIWRVPAAKNATVFGFLWQRFTSFLMVFGIGLILLISLVISASVSAVGQFIHANFPGIFSLM
ncbi:MAG TPA: YihY/virulence factor BrkB family protein, partial [Candidatus Methylacidiphilales bacterium]|nr:YihY/virulence factor BrkB family protein [Candidatus Methylacidiphilales bacterium]